MPESTVRTQPKSEEDTPAENGAVPAEHPERDEPSPARRDWLRRLGTSPVTVAIVTWLIATPVAFVLARVIDIDPFSEQGTFLPLGVGCALLVLMTALAWRRRAGDLVTAAAAGLFAAWVAFFFRVALNGTPFGTTGLVGDRGRMAAASMRYTVTPWPADSIVPTVTAEYPPLFPWLVGRASLIVDVPAWRLLAFAEVGLLSFGVLAAFLMWRRLVPAPVALAISAAGLLVYGDPRKAFAIITLLVFIPWLISAFTEDSPRRLHWLPAGVIAGLTMNTYNGWFPLGVFGIVAIIVTAWRRSENRARYLRHALLTIATGAVVSAPYLVPYGYAVLTKGGQAISDEYVTTGLSVNSFPFLAPTLLGALQLVGLAGLIWYRRRTWWAWPMLYLVIGSYLYWLLLGLRFVFSTHTTLFYYVPLLTSATLVSAGVLTIVRAAPALARKFTFAAPYRTGAAVTAVALLWVGFSYWQDWRPLPGLAVPLHNEYTAWAHREPLPDCTYTKYAPAEGRFGCYPVTRIKAEVEQVRGVGALPNVVASDERLYSYLPWRGYLGVDRTSANTFVYWDDRFAELTRLSKITDAGEFARETAGTQFGPIDVFVMGRVDSQTWAAVGTQFHRSQFDPATWEIVDDLPSNTVLAVRRG
jgi:hypothetical protein